MQKLCKNDKNIYGCCLQQEYPRGVCLTKSRKPMISLDPQFNSVRSSIFNLLVTENLCNYPAIALSKLYFEQLQENNILRRRLTLDKFGYVSYILYGQISSYSVQIRENTDTFRAMNRTLINKFLVETNLI